MSVELIIGLMALGIFVTIIGYGLYLIELYKQHCAESERKENE